MTVEEAPNFQEIHQDLVERLGAAVMPCQYEVRPHGRRYVSAIEDPPQIVTTHVTFPKLTGGGFSVYTITLAPNEQGQANEVSAVETAWHQQEAPSLSLLQGRERPTHARVVEYGASLGGIELEAARQLVHQLTRSSST